MRKLLLSIGILLIILVILVVGFFALNSYIYNEKQADEVGPTISSFEECIDAGYPVLDSYPEQCATADGKRFMRSLPEGELADVIFPITTQGMLICLPHWDTSAPQTTECAFGLQDDSGNYYVLRDSDPSQPTISATPTNIRVEVVGTLVPGSHQRHQSIGTIEVEEISEL